MMVRRADQRPGPVEEETDSNQAKAFRGECSSGQAELSASFRYLLIFLKMM